MKFVVSVLGLVSGGLFRKNEFKGSFWVAIVEGLLKNLFNV